MLYLLSWYLKAPFLFCSFRLAFSSVPTSTPLSIFCPASHHQPSTLPQVPEICPLICRRPCRVICGVRKHVCLVFISGSMLYNSPLFLTVFPHYCPWGSIYVAISPHFCVVFCNIHQPQFIFPFCSGSLEHRYVPILQCCLNISKNVSLRRVAMPGSYRT